MKYLTILASAVVAPMLLTSCPEPRRDVVYYVPVQPKKTTKTTTTVVKPKKETAEGFEAVSKPGSYSN
ncbi:MAG: hypothetical protein QM755_08055 [Luteolibacter sp.]